MVVDKIQGVALDPQSVITPVRHVAGLIQQKTGYDLWSESNLQSVLGYLPRAGQWLVGGIVNFAVNLVVLLFVLYFMLIGGLRMETYCREILPFDRCAARSVMRAVRAPASRSRSSVSSRSAWSVCSWCRPGAWAG